MMNISLNKILVISGILLVSLIGIYFGYYRFSSMSTDLTNIKAQNELLVEKSSENKDLYVNLLSKIEKRDEQYNKYIKLVDDTNKKHIQLIAKYNREAKQDQLKKVLASKPELVEKIINGKLDELFKCIEKATKNPNVTINCHFDIMLPERP